MTFNTPLQNLMQVIEVQSSLANIGVCQKIDRTLTNVCCDNIVKATELADGWDWNEEYFNFALENFNIEQLMRAGSEYSDFVWSDGTMAIIWPN